MKQSEAYKQRAPDKGASISGYRLYMGMTILAIFIAIPFVFFDFIGGQYMTFAGGLIILISLCAVFLRMLLMGRHSVTLLYYGLLPGFLITIVSAMAEQQVIGALWAYPAVATFFVLFDLKRALSAALIIFLVLTPAMLLELDFSVALRLIVTLATLIICFTACCYGAQKKQTDLYHMAICDPMTGLLNRASLRQQLKGAIRDSIHSSTSVSLIVLDIDDFKQINDLYGHPVGDQVLNKVAEILKGQFRSSDLKFRVGGEEFLILLPSVGEHRASQLAEELLIIISSANLLPKSSVTLSAGVAQLNPKEGLDCWLARADAALYAAKSKGKNRVCTA
jgi:diguanylate cyclase (GGDEF)-like protein